MGLSKRFVSLSFFLRAGKMEYARKNAPDICFFLCIGRSIITDVKNEDLICNPVRVHAGDSSIPRKVRTISPYSSGA